MPTYHTLFLHSWNTHMIISILIKPGWTARKYFSTVFWKSFVSLSKYICIYSATTLMLYLFNEDS